MSGVKKDYTVNEIIKILNSIGYHISRQNKHPIYSTKDQDKIKAGKENYALTITHNPLKIGTLLSLIKFLGFATLKQFEKYWRSVK